MALGCSTAPSQSVRHRGWEAAPFTISRVGRETPQKGRSLMAKRVIVYRDSKDGQFVTQQFAVRHPATTERQHVYVPAPNKK